MNRSLSPLRAGAGILTALSLLGLVVLALLPDRSAGSPDGTDHNTKGKVTHGNDSSLRSAGI